MKIEQTSLIRAREALLDRVTSIQPTHVLNPYSTEATDDPGLRPAAELKRALDGMKIAAMDEHGNQVNYAVLRNSPVYSEYRLKCSPGLRDFDPSSLITRDAKMAFWINLYNALVLDAVINTGIQRSVTEGRLGMLSFFRRAAYYVGGQRLSADDIEHGILRANRGHPFLPGSHFVTDDPRRTWIISPPDVRIHFALNCASRSCPPIQAYTPEHIDAQLDLAARNFVNARVKINPERRELLTSAIFRWFKVDFGGRKGVIAFILDHLPDDDRRAWLSEYQHKVRLRYEPYDWGLNTIETTSENGERPGQGHQVERETSKEFTL